MKLSAKTKKLLEARIKSGRYASADDAMVAALTSLKQQETFGSFAPGELDALVAEGERSVNDEGVVEAEKVFTEIRRKSARRRRKAG